MSRARLTAISLGVVALADAVSLVPARASTFEAAPAASRTQVEAALRVLAPAFAGVRRRLPAGAAGTIEHVVHAYAPARFHPVDEGTLPAARPGSTCPADMVSVGGRFCVDRYEGSLLERGDAGASGVEHPHNQPLAPGHLYVARSVAGVMPQAYISASEAEAACKAAFKRLCQPVEWRAACAGSEGLAYPYGPTRIPGKCHDNGVAPMVVFHADTIKKGWGALELNDPRLNALDGTVARTGAFPDCVTDHGVYDMVGNLHEWTADPNGTFQGGYWLDTSQHGDGCAYRTIAHGYGYHDYSTGFRCCADSR